MRPEALIEEQLTRSVIGAFYEVYNSLGFGFLEHLYVMALETGFERAGMLWRGKSACPSSTGDASSGTRSLT
jgi:hypothetical protein